MKKKILLLVFTFLLWTLIFVLQKPVFLMAYCREWGVFQNLFPVVWHGLPLDLSMAGYLTALPGLVLLASALPLRPGKPQPPRFATALRWTARVWFAVAAVIVALAFVANLALYGYWNFPLDSTPIFFITSSPSAAMASVEWWQGLLGIIGIAVVAGVIILAFHWLWAGYGKHAMEGSVTLWQWVPLLLLDGLLVLPMRGGVTVSTMNTGKAYYSPTVQLNHAAVNPLFSFMESMTHQEDFAKMYRFMDDKEAHRLAAQVLPKLRNPLDGSKNPSTMRQSQIISDSLRVDRLKDFSGPDIYIVILESFSDTLTRQPNVTPNLNRLKAEGAYFKNFYANGFRTDRGLVSILLGYPAPGAVSLMKYPRKTARLASIAAALPEYTKHYYYGGDADFTNMRSFLINQGYGNITADTDFPVSERLSKWGVPDHLLFQRVEKDIMGWQGQKPRLTVIQTSSSHEPFDVPYHRLSDKVLNAFAYTDSCIGQFVSFLKKQKRWNRSLVIFCPDHLGAWPENADNFASWRFHIPMVWVGGAVRRRMVVDTYGSQQDIAATLLGEIGVENSYLTFSKDLLNPQTVHYAYFMMNDGFGVKTDSDEVIYDNKQQRVIVSKGKDAKRWLAYGQALLQVLFDDIASKK